MKSRSLMQKLVQTYAGWFTVYLVVIIVSSVGCVSMIVNSNLQKNQDQLVQSLNENIENYFQEMNTFSVDLLVSKEFKQAALRELPEDYETGRSVVETFSRLYKEAYKMIPKKYQVGILVDGQYYIWMGSHYYISGVQKEGIHTYDNLVRDETPVVKFLTTNEYLEQTNPKGETGQSYIALSRSMDDRNVYLNGRAVLEILVEEEEFVHAMQRLSGTEEEGSIRINIFDSDGAPLYRESDLDLQEYVQSGKTGNDRQGGNLIFVRQLLDGRVTVVYTQDSAAYWEGLMKFWAIAIGLSVAVIGITILVNYKISKEISRPIRVMSQRVQQINLNTGTGFEEIETDISELQILSASLHQMSGQIQESVRQIITLKDYEVHARMLALQAQMQPHFLFNTLMMIAGMAEKEGNRGIYRICMSLNSMFRYIAAEETAGVQMFEEIRHIDSYVEIMKERFPESVVEIEIPLEMMDLRIPKLIIQPLVENAFKYCNRQSPRISVRGRISGSGDWRVEVTDNGTGFSREKKAEIMEKCLESLKCEQAFSTQINGMGMVNVYVRLKMFYGEHMFYEIEENTSRVVIGGARDGRADPK